MNDGGLCIRYNGFDTDIVIDKQTIPFSRHLLH